MVAKVASILDPRLPVKIDGSVEESKVNCPGSAQTSTITLFYDNHTLTVCNSDSTSVCNNVIAAFCVGGSS